jgi:hypothetical protein
MKVLKIAHDTPKHKIIMLPPDRLADRLPQALREGIADFILAMCSGSNAFTPSVRMLPGSTASTSDAEGASWSAASNLALVPRRDQPLRQKPTDRF